jgi:hypothetical protein
MLPMASFTIRQGMKQEDGEDYTLRSFIVRIPSNITGVIKSKKINWAGHTSQGT